MTSFAPRARRAALAGIACSVCAGPAGAQTAAGAAPASPYAADMSLPSAERAMREGVTRIAPHVYAIHAPLSFGPTPLANEMLVEQRDGLVLIDAGKTRGAGERIVSAIRSVSSRPVKAVVLTHWHQDHVLGLGPIVEAWPGAVVIASEATRRAMLEDESYRTTPRARGETATRDSVRARALRGYADAYGPHLRDSTLSDAERRGWADVVGVLNLRIADEQGTYLVVPTRTFAGRLALDDPDAPVEVRSLGGAHTEDDVVAWLPRQRVVAAGDVVAAPIPYTGSHPLAWPAALDSIERLRPAVIVPGHGPIQRDDRYVRLERRAFVEVRRQVEPLAAGAALSDEDLAARVDLSALRAEFARGDSWLAYWFDQYFAPNAVIAYHELRAAQTH